MASFSNNELNVSTLLSFFDSLWIRSEIDKQNIINKHTLKYLKNLNLKMKIIDANGSLNVQKKNN